MCADGAKQIRADGHSIPALLEAILQLMPLDSYCWSPVQKVEMFLFLNCINDGNQASVMDVTDSDRCKGLTDPPVWPQYKRLLKEAEKRDVPLYNIF